MSYPNSLLAPVALLLGAAPAFAASPDPLPSPEPATAAVGQGRIPVLILTGENRTDWRWTSTWMRKVLEDSGKFDVEVTMYPNGSLADAYDTSRFDVFVVDYAGVRWGEPAESNFLKTISDGKGAVFLGAAVSTFPDWEAYRSLTGFSADAADPTPFGSVELRAVAVDHPLVEGMDSWPTHSDRIQTGLALTPETKFQHIGSAAPTGRDAGPPVPALVVGPYGKGRVVSTPLGWVDWNDQASWASQTDPVFEQLLLRSVEWAASGKLTPLSRVLPNTLTDADRAAGWKLLFDGTSADGWKSLDGGFPADRWVIENGELHVLGGDNGQDLFLEHALDQFELELEWRVAAERGAKAGTGLALHDGSGNQNYQQSFVSNEAEQIAESERLLRPAGEWNHSRVVAHENQIESYLNGSRVTTLYTTPGQWAERVQGENLLNDAELSNSPLARLALQGGGEDVSFRNIRIRPIVPAAPADEGSSEPSGPAAVDLLANGLNDWRYVPQEVQRGRVSGPDQKVFSIEDGNEGRLLVDAGWPAGYLATRQGFGDYLLEFDWRNDPKFRQAGEAGVYLVFEETANQMPSGGKRLWPDGVVLDLSPNAEGNLNLVGPIRKQGQPWVTVDRSRSNGQVVRRMRLRLVNRIGDWNHVEVRYSGGALTVKLNGEVVNAVTDLHMPSHLAIKATSTKLHFRNMTVTPLRGN